MGLAAAVGHLELADRLGALAGEPGGNVLDEVPEGVGGVREREELRRVLVDGAASGPGEDLVEIGGELGEGELAGAEFGLEADDLVPRGGVHRRCQDPLHVVDMPVVDGTGGVLAGCRQIEVEINGNERCLA